ncbi:MAG TPA: PEP-CTERM sorting domain-containing protein [Fimbriimonadaceae bacterium]|nr:PEP-CTERM sorting domain-containing protein [Fimbriimonadaceae bacterium]HRJ33017.1 PEP-CTERM sorting domain-containing protein [Fimbriimonadaceae bacterium]
MLKISIKKVALVALCLSGAASSHANLLLNGGFETGDFSNWTVSGPTLPTVVSDPHTGSFSANFAGSSPSLNSISQSFFANSGWTYDVSLWVKNNGIGDDRLMIQIGGDTPYDSFPIDTPLESWSLVSFLWTSDSTGPDGFFIRGFDPNTFQVDDVRIVAQPVPEPATMAALGLGALALVRRRRAKAS